MAPPSCWACLRAEISDLEDRIACVVAAAFEAAKPELVALAKASAMEALAAASSAMPAAAPILSAAEVVLDVASPPPPA